MDQVGEGAEHMLRLVTLVMMALGSGLVVFPGASRPATGPSPQRALLDDGHAPLDDQQQASRRRRAKPDVDRALVM